MKYEIYSGAGNDFVMIDNRNNQVPFEEQKDFTERICRDNFKNIDGVIFVEKPGDASAEIRMNYYNRDGSYGAMCGNGARCIARYVHDKKIIDERKFVLEAVDKKYGVEINERTIRIIFPEPGKPELDIKIDLANKEIFADYINVGSDHIIIFLDDEKNRVLTSGINIDSLNVNELGRKIRYHKRFQPDGGNVNFVTNSGENKIKIRTYERGVERETLACGTGILSSGLIASIKGITLPPVKVVSQSGETLIVDFIIDGDKIKQLSLEGSAEKINEGEINT